MARTNEGTGQSIFDALESPHYKSSRRQDDGFQPDAQAPPSRWRHNSSGGIAAKEIDE
jgi:hypothetical protein